MTRPAATSRLGPPFRGRRRLPIAGGCLLALVGCAGHAISPSQRLLLDDADRFNGLLRPALLDERDGELRRYLAAVQSRLASAAKARPRRRPRQPLDVRRPPAAPGRRRQFQRLLHRRAAPVRLRRALPAFCATEDELAAVLAHAYAHLLGGQIPSHIAGESPRPDRKALRRILHLAIHPGRGSGGGRAVVRVVHARGLGSVALRHALPPGRSAPPPSTPPGLAAALRRKSESARPQAAALPASAHDWRQPPIADARRFQSIQSKAADLDPPNSAPADTGRLVEALPDCFSLPPCARAGPGPPGTLPATAGRCADGQPLGERAAIAEPRGGVRPG